MAQPVKPFRLEDHVEVSKEFRLEDHIETPKAFDYTHLVETPKTEVSSLAEKFVRSHPIARALGMGPEDEKPASIGQMAEDYSARQAEQASPLVPGVPVRQDFVAKTRKDLLGGEEVTPELGVVKRTQEAVLADTEFPKKLDAVAGALEKGKVQDSERPQGMLDSLIGGMESTGRAVQAFGATVRGDEEKVLSLREEQQDVLRTPELESFYNEIQKRQAGLEEEDKTWTQAAKDVFGALQQNPEGGMHFLIEQLPNGLVPLATGAAGFAVGGLPGGITGLFGGNVALSAGFRALEEQAQEFSPEQQKDVLKKGAVEGGVITAVDVATLGLSHFILGATRRAVESATRQTVARLGRENGLELKDILKNPQLVNEVKMAQTRAFAATTSLGQRLTRGTAVVGLEGLGEGTGAYLGKLAADGEASKLEAVLEGFAGLAVGGIQGAALSAMQQKETAKLIDLTKTQTEAEQQVHVDMEESLQPEMVKETLEPILNEPMPEITPEELLEARKQQHRMETGVESILPDPEAVEDVVGLDELMLDPLYKSPGEWQTAVQDHMQKDLDAGISAIVARRRALEAFPEITPMTEKPITWSSVPEQVGLNLKQAKLAPGSVAIVGGFNEQFSPAYTQALGQTVDAWAKRFLGPKERIILNLSGLKGSAVGGYQQTPSGIHVISPRELVRTEISERFTNEGVMLSPSGFDGQGYNTFTQQQTFGALTHEFGHALGLAHFDNAMPEQFIGIVGKLDSGKLYTENQLAEMPQAEAAVVRDYQERKRRILANEMKADELIENWVGPWKLGKDLMTKQARDLYWYANEVLLREDKLFGTSHLSSTPLNQLSALDLIHAMGRETRTEVGMNAKGEPTTTRILPDENEIAESNRKAEAYYLQFSEFFAEQFSRYAHDKDIGKGTALGIYFRRALEVLRKFFQALKTPSGKSGEVVLKAGEAFNNWVDQLHVSKAMGEALAKQRKRNAQRFKARLERGLKEVKETVRQAPATLVKNLVQERKQKEEGVGEGNAVEDLEFLAEDTQAKEDLKTRIREAIPNVLDRDRADLMRLVGQGRLQEAEDQLADIVSERAKEDKTGGYQDTPDGTKVEEIVSKIGSKEEASLWKKAVNFTAEAGYKLVQLQQLAHESTDYGLKAFVTYQNQMLALKNNLLQKGTEVAENWENLSRRQQKELDTLLMAELEKGEHFTELTQDQGTGKWQHSMGDRYRIFAKEQGIELTTPDGEKLADLIARLKNSILQHIQVSESIAVQIIRDKYAKAPLVAKQKEIEIRQNAQKWREAPYVPMGRYGNYFVKVFGKDSEGNRQLVYRTHFEDSASQDLMVKKLQKKGLDVAYGKVHEETALQLSLPTEFLSVLADSGEFNSEQLAKIGEMMMPLKSEKAFSKLARDADRIAGASADRLRDYANWIEDSSNFISKLAYGRKLTQARSITKRDMESAQGLGEVETAREKQRLLDTMSKAQEFMMHPLEEWYKARSVTALTFLMWAPKTALMNLTGLFQTWAAVTADYGDVKGNLAMGKATKDLMAGKLDYSDNWALDKALEDGLIDQGFGYFMSGLANAGNLARRVRPTVLGKAGRAFVDMGMWPFKAVELANRRLTLLTIFRAEKEKLKDTEMAPEEVMRTAYETASRYTRLLQNDYASGNRPEIMRGKKSIFMVFLSYPQYMLWIMSGGFERGTRLAALNAGGNPRSRFGGMTMRMWLIFLSLSGLEGLPFGKMLMDMLQGMWNKFGTGENIKVEAHRFMKESMGMEDRYWRDVVQRGFLHDVLGVDLSGSYSLGTPLPGTGLFDIQARNWQEFVGAAFGEFAGPFGGMVKAPAALGTDADGITMKDVGRAVPGFVGNIAKGIDAAQGGVTTSKGVRILKDEQGAYRDPTKAEIALIAGGFRLSTVANYQNLEKLKREQVDYWMGRRTGLKQQFRTAVKDKDPELRADVEEAIREFNKEIPNRGLHLSGKELMQFVRQNQRTIRKLEQNRYPEKQRGLMKDIDTLMN